jgi:hypothetical protein
VWGHVPVDYQRVGVTAEQIKALKQLTQLSVGNWLPALGVHPLDPGDLLGKLRQETLAIPLLSWKSGPMGGVLI